MVHRGPEPTDEFDAYARAHVTELLHLARALSRTREDAEDLTQDALMRIMRKWPQVRSADDRPAYARRILVNEFYTRARRRRLRLVPLHTAHQPTASSEPGVELGERLDLQAAILDLPLGQRTAVVLRYYLQLSTADIAVWMGIRESTVRSNLSRGMRQLSETAHQPDQADHSTRRNHAAD